MKPPMTYPTPPSLTLRYTPAVAVLVTASVLGALPLAAVTAQGAPGPPQSKVAPKDPKAAPPVRAEAKPAEKPPTKPQKSVAKAQKPSAKPVLPAKQDASVAFFREGRVPRLKIQIPEAELIQLRRQNREYVRCTVVEEGGKQYEDVGIHLKGGVGSFRRIDQQPGLTLNFDKFRKGQEFYDLDKIHLNNSVQDPGYLNELITSELFLAAGVPAARTTHARVWLNGRDLGFYVLKEGFNKRFLRRHSLDADGNLYEGAVGNDIDGKLSLKNGKGPDDRSDVKALIEACQEPDATKRWQRLEQLVDIERFLTFVAVEWMACHWDSYSGNRNNYRLYFDPKSGKAQFFPHGMDQTFHYTNLDALAVPYNLVGRAILNNPEWRGCQRERVIELMKLFAAEGLQKRVDEHHQRLRPVLAEIGPGPATSLDERVKTLKNALAAREKTLRQQTGVAEPPLVSTSLAPTGIAALTRWEPAAEPADAKLAMADPVDGVTKVGSLAIATGPSGRCVASWRTRVTLPAGRYRFEARARTEGVKALQEPSGTGAGIRLSGGGRTNKLEGTSNWTALTHEFQVRAATQEVVLVAELRAVAGQAFFDKSSLRLVRVNP